MIANHSGKFEIIIDNRGFTFIEVLVALAIFSIGILAVASMQIQSVNLNAKARVQTEATTLAVERLERLKMLPYDHADLDEATIRTRIKLAAIESCGRLPKRWICR